MTRARRCLCPTHLLDVVGSGGYRLSLQDLEGFLNLPLDTFRESPCRLQGLPFDLQ
jgi:hypothetical protein